MTDVVTRVNPRFPRSAGPAVASLSVAILVVTLAISAPSYQTSPFEQELPAWLAGLGLAAGAALATASWVERDARPAVAVGLGVTEIALLVPGWAGWPWLPATAQAWALAVAPLAVAGAMQVGIRWSRERRSSRRLRVVWGLTISAVVVHVIGYDPLADPGCARTCAEVQPLAAALISTPTSLAIVTSLVAAAGVTAASVLAPAVMDRRSGGIALASLIAVGLLAAPWIAPTDQILPGSLAALILGAAPLVANLRMRRVRGEMQRLVGQLSEGGAMGNPAVDSAWGIEFAVPDDERWVDAAGHVVEPDAESRRSLVVSDAAGPVLRLHLATGEDPGDVLAALTPARMLALRNLRSAAVSRARLAEVRASQRRIVAASDSERERIERDLHDGAQQRLVSAALHLSLARNRMPAATGEPADTGLAEADAAVREALEGLRLLGHGIFPTTLASEGLGAALEDLARASDVPVNVEVPELDLKRDVALAAYALVSAVLALARRAPRARSANLVATANDGSLELCVRLVGGARLDQTDLVDVADRVGAVGGHLSLESIDGGVVITAVMPCGS
jgi:signal transduction histidine kinase